MTTPNPSIERIAFGVGSYQTLGLAETLIKITLITWLLVAPLLGCSSEPETEKQAFSYRHPAFDSKALKPTVDILNRLSQVKT